ncbi:MAG: MASE1 domain-containing protein [Phycisphaerales bacterium]|nr:MASE1 domain-containing protein [Phycisphaerales bacterium]
MQHPCGRQPAWRSHRSCFWGNRIWPGIFLGALVANLTTEGNLAAASGIAAGNTLEALTGGYLVNRFAGGRAAFDRAATIFRYVVLAAIVAPAISATIGVSSLVLGGLAPPSIFGNIWLTWWLGDAVSSLAYAPLLLIWTLRPWHRFGLSNSLEAVALVAVVALVSGVVFRGWFTGVPAHMPLAFLCIPPLLWAAYRFHQLGAMASILIVSSIALWGTVDGTGPFAFASTNLSLIVLQAFVATVSVSMLVLGATVRQHDRIEQSLRQSEEQYRASFELAATGKAQIDPATGRFLRVNARMCEITGYTADELLAITFLDLNHPDDRLQTQEQAQRLLRGEINEYTAEKRYVRKDGSTIWVQVNGTVLRDEQGRALRALGVIQDITARKKAQDEVARHRDHLERLVAERTIELERTHQRLRLSERMAAMGTLSAGIGHDMGNLLLPVKARLEALESLQLPNLAQSHLVALNECVGYLTSLTRGLRMFAQDPAQTDADEATDLNSWQADVKSLYKSVLPRSVELAIDIPPHVPAASISSAALTQAVLNLLNNAREAIGPDKSGLVTVRAQADDHFLRLVIEDDGPGMSPQVRSRALEPFFTTKTRRLSTGLGLSLVHGIIGAADGKVEIESPVRNGRGCAIVLWLPICRHMPLDELQSSHLNGPSAAISLSDQRLQALILHLLQWLGCSVTLTDGEPGQASIWFTEHSDERLLAARDFLNDRPDRMIVVVGDAPPAWQQLGARTVEPHFKLRSLHQTIRDLLTKALRSAT